MVAARYFDTVSSRAHPVALAVHDGVAVLHNAAGEELRRAPLASLRVSERNKRAPRLVTFDDGAYCEITDHAAFDAMLAATGHREGWVSRAQNSWRLTVVALLGLVAFVLAAYFYLLPWTAGLLAATVPTSIEKQLGDATLRAMDEGAAVQPSRLPAAEVQRIRDNFAALRWADAPAHRYEIEFRKGGRFGANALALPGGTIVVTDELVALIGTGAGMTGVLAHEAGHVAQRHGLQQAIQASAVSALVAYFLGDFSTVLATVPAAMLSMHYSREHEREADAYAVEAMRRNRLPVSAFVEVLEKLDGGERSRRADDAQHGKDAASFFSTHPLTRERIEAIRQAEAGR